MANEANNRPSFTSKGRLRTAPMPILYGKEWGAFKRLVQALEGIDNSLKDLVEMKKQELEVERLRAS